MSPEPGPDAAHGSAITPALEARLRAAGVEAAATDDPAEAWRSLHLHEGEGATLLDRYELEAAARGITARDLDPATRRALALEIFTTRDPTFAIVPGSERARGDAIEVVAHDPSWATSFGRWRDRLAGAMGPVALRIDHVGSTAVPGLAAKPIIDIQVSVAELDDEAGYVAAIESLGVAFRAREAGQRYFRPGGGARRDVQIHVCAAGGEWERTHLLFRDYLRAAPAAAMAYQALKTRLAADFGDDRLAYNEGKSGFIRRTLADAEAWGSSHGWRP